MHRLLAVALSFSIGVFLVNQVYDLDIWWQVAIGRDILAQGTVPAIDRFTAAALGRPYHDSHWFFQVLVALADRAGGMVGVQLLMVALWTAVFICVQRAASRRVSIVYWGPLLFLAAMASTERFLPRPELITFLGVAFFYWRLQEGRYRSWRDLAALLLMQLLWANGHGLFVLGPFLVGCYWLAAFLGKGEPGREALPALSRLLAMVFGVTLLTPYGWGSWRYAFLLFQEAGPQAPKLLKSVGELSPTFGPANMGGMAFWFFLGLVTITALLAAWALLRKQPVAIPRLLIVMTLFVLSLTGRRNMVLFVLVAAPFAAEMLGDLPKCSRRAEQGLALATVLVLLAWSWYPLSGDYYLRMELPSRTGLGATPSFFPHDLPAFLEKFDYRGQVFNANTLGGFYLYHRYPRQAPFTDGRWEIYAAATFDEISRGIGSAASWQPFAERHKVSGILLQHASGEAKAMLPFLREHPDWRLVYLDTAASFWVRGDASGSAPVLSLTGEAPLPEAQRLDDCLMLDLFFRQMGMEQLRARNLERALRFGKETGVLLANLGATLLNLKDYVGAQEAFERLYRESPRNATALNELAFLAYRRGDLQQAEDYLRQLLEAEPGNVDAHTNLERVRDARLVSPAGRTK